MREAATTHPRLPKIWCVSACGCAAIRTYETGVEVEFVRGDTLFEQIIDLCHK